MKKTAFSFLAFAAITCMGDNPQSDIGYWLPQGFEEKINTARIEADFDGIGLVEIPVTIDDNEIVDLYGAYEKFINENPGKYIGFDYIQTIGAVYKDLQSTKLAIKQIAEKLAAEFSEEEITDPETGASEKLTPAPPTTPTVNNFYASNIINLPVNADEKSLHAKEETNDKGKTIKKTLSLKAFPNTIGDVGKIPFFGWDSGGTLGWFALKDLLDGETIAAETNPAYNNSIIDGGISLAGWKNPTNCEANLVNIITNTAEQGAISDRQDHKILTRYERAGEEPVLHYLSVGDALTFPEIPDNAALRFIGTAGGNGVVVGTGTETNDVLFATKPDSNVQVDVERYGEKGVKISIGVYYL